MTYVCWGDSSVRSKNVVATNRSYNQFQNILRPNFSMFDRIFFSPQMKRWAIIIYKHGIYELPHELPNALRLKILGKLEISGKCLNHIE